MLLHAWPLDWTAVLALFGVTLLEGIHRVPRGAMTAYIVGLGSWKVQAPRAATRRPQIVSWAAPLFLHVVLLPTTNPVRPPGLRRRWRQIRRSLPTIRLVATVELVLLVIGVPAAAGLWGIGGMMFALALVLESTAIIVLESAFVLRQSGLARREVWRRVRGLASPFAAPRAPEVVIESALAGVAQLSVLQLLLPAGAFAAWVRPRAYDSLQIGAPHDPELDALLSLPARRALVETPPSDDVYCPRCGAEYRIATSACADCHDVQLRQPGVSRRTAPGRRSLS